MSEIGTDQDPLVGALLGARGAVDAERRERPRASEWTAETLREETTMLAVVSIAHDLRRLADSLDGIHSHLETRSILVDHG